MISQCCIRSSNSLFRKRLATLRFLIQCLWHLSRPRHFGFVGTADAYIEKISMIVRRYLEPLLYPAKGPWSWHPPPTKKNRNLFGNYGLFMGSRMAQEIIFGLFPFSRKMILKWGGASFPWSQRPAVDEHLFWDFRRFYNEWIRYNVQL